MPCSFTFFQLLFLVNQNQSNSNHIAFLLDGGFPNNIRVNIFQTTKMEKYENYREKLLSSKV